ncbi:hypothetical protein J4221_07435 [Candidatus Pacearchaeota archaeon]|nr:hypothetical protein [Candidatus Pacearchaeota archaeon]
MILNKYTKDLETNHLCDVCSEAVTNPICPFCLAAEIDVWLTLYPDLRKKLMPKLNKYLNNISNRITTYGTLCIKCNKRQAFVCTYCFTEYVLIELNNLDVGNFIIKEFIDFFNFDLNYKGYYKEIENGIEEIIN